MQSSDDLHRYPMAFFVYVFKFRPFCEHVFSKKRFFCPNGCLSQHNLLHNQSTVDNLITHNHVALLSVNIFSLIGILWLLNVCLLSESFLLNQRCSIFMLLTFHFHYECDEWSVYALFYLIYE